MNGGTGLSVQNVSIPIGDVGLRGTLSIPSRAHGIVLFAHGSGSGRYSSRNRYVAEVLQRAGIATLLFDLLTAEEERVDQHTMHLRFDIGLLARRLIGATDWVAMQPKLRDLPIGYFGASTGAAAALVAAAMRPRQIDALVSRGGRPDLAGASLSRVRAPTLLIVGGRDVVVIGLNEEALARMGNANVDLQIVPGASHLFEEPGALEEVARLTRDWFSAFLLPVGNGSSRS
jgi:putative phosphoribosyl transferase